ncbi:MAG: rod shape-determining protein MreC [Bacteroidales bacterium]
MRNLIRFILRYHFFILFILFETIALFLVFQNNNYQNALAFNLSRNVKGYINSKIFSFRQYVNLQETNKLLLEENTRLRNSLLSSYKIKIPAAADVEFDSAWARQYNFIPANVISSSVNKQNNFISIDRGSVHGVAPDMAVISSNGVVGVITGSSDHFSTVIPLLNIDLRISSKLKKTGYFGSLHWEGNNPELATLQDIPHHVSLSPGDTVVTSGFSAIFPEGIMIGTIDDFDIKGGNFYTIDVRLSTNFRKLNHAYVIQNIFREELDNLERSQGYD